MSKSETIEYIFFVTVLPQIISICAFRIVLSIATAWGKYDSVICFFLGLISIITYQFLLLGLSVFIKSYGLSVFSSVSKDYVQYSPSEPMTKTKYYIHKNSSIFGDGYTVQTREISQSGCLLSLGLLALVNSITGIFKFLIEAVRVNLSPERQEAWDSCKEYFNEKKGKESVLSFMKMPVMCCCIMLATFILYSPVKLVLDGGHSVKNLEFVITEKQNTAYSNYHINMIYYGEIENKGKGEPSSIHGTVHYKNRSGDILLSSDVIIKAPFQTPYDPFLQKGEKWNIAIDVKAQPTDSGAQELWNTELEDTEIIFDVSEIWYDDGIHKDYPKEEKIVLHKFE